jgi:aspartyl-tRNA(Asn)/glutamyl-tRNA(Gln) amidotransferase subunit C
MLRGWFWRLLFMFVTVEDIRKVSRLARIKIEDSKIEEIRSNLSDILNFVEQLRKVDCSRIDDSPQCTSLMHERKDVAIPCDQSVMNNAPQKECNMFVVPKVIS